MEVSVRQVSTSNITDFVSPCSSLQRVFFLLPPATSNPNPSSGPGRTKRTQQTRYLGHCGWSHQIESARPPANEASAAPLRAPLPLPRPRPSLSPHTTHTVLAIPTLLLLPPSSTQNRLPLIFP
ncbi:hypothetical protein CGGC5_v003492 [Colletotrichum fructicola Nara gc5]|uniref:Uncharacterized protein n=1 Tax=Colletotrichum fructicola (strain Nara gc5) TaxID=1213859 RepID=A0A7J6JFW2_COLFN|nr:hypothetical protein CGGC5_v003492 [Colletotrichum fructicola Nara gc5]